MDSKRAKPKSQILAVKPWITSSEDCSRMFPAGTHNYLCPAGDSALLKLSCPSCATKKRFFWNELHNSRHQIQRIWHHELFLGSMIFHSLQEGWLDLTQETSLGGQYQELLDYAQDVLARYQSDEWEHTSTDVAVKDALVMQGFQATGKLLEDVCNCTCVKLSTWCQRCFEVPLINCILHQELCISNDTPLERPS